MKIIDTHMHTGLFLRSEGIVDMSAQAVNDYIKQSGTTKAIISNTNCVEFNDGSYIENKTCQVTENDKMLKAFSGCDNINFSFWIRPHYEKFNNSIADFIVKNKNKFVMLKIHPHHSNINLDDNKLKDYFDFANQIKIPVAVHTVKGGKSETRELYDIAKQFKNTNFIAVHMDMISDHIESAKYIAKQDNLFGDTTWVTYSQYLELVKITGEDKIFFGTDAPISPTTYDFYKDYYLNANQHEKLFHKNIAKIISI